MKHQKNARFVVALGALAIAVVSLWWVQGMAGGDTQSEKALNERLQHSDTGYNSNDKTQYQSQNPTQNEATPNRTSTSQATDNTINSASPVYTSTNASTSPTATNTGRYDTYQNTGSTYDNPNATQYEQYVYWERPNKNKVMNVTSLWPQASQKAIADMLYKYGNPDIVTNESVIWRNKGPFLRITVLRNGVPHSFPKEHTDVLEEVIAYKVPVEKIDDLARFDGSVIVDRTAGTMTVRCNNEASNFAALNLAHEIITNSNTVGSAQDELADIANTNLLAASSDSHARGYTGGLEFTPYILADTRDPGRSYQYAQAPTR